MVEHNGLNGSDDITVTGHSKGGNKSQYVTVNSDIRTISIGCISPGWTGLFPGRPSLLSREKVRGGGAYQAYLEKMYSICGENDYVNPLGGQNYSGQAHPTT